MPSRRKRPLICKIFDIDFLIFMCIATASGAICYGIFVLGNDVKKVTEEITRIRDNEGDTTRKLENIEGILETIKQSQKDGWVKSKRIVTDEKKTNASDKDIQKLIRTTIEEYNNGRFLRADFALESAGGKVLGIGDTEQYYSCASSSLFGVTLCEGSNTPKALIQANVLPGECWAFKGSSGTAIIQLTAYIFVNGVTLEHISKNVSLTGNIDSAPKQFSVLGLNNEKDKQGLLFGKFMYDADGPPVQFFEIEVTSKSYMHVKFNVHSNYGNREYTCVYRLQVHGKYDNLTTGKGGTC